MNSDREWLQTCLYGQHDIWADWVRFGERIADTQEAAGWGTPHALRLLAGRRTCVVLTGLFLQPERRGISRFLGAREIRAPDRGQAHARRHRNPAPEAAFHSVPRRIGTAAL